MPFRNPYLWSAYLSGARYYQSNERKGSERAASVVEERQEPSQRVVTAEEAEHLIMQGWKFLGTLPNGKVVVQK